MGLVCAPSSPKAATVPVYLWSEDTSYFENEYQHKAGEFI